MKVRGLIVILLLVVTTQSFAQIEKGTVAVGGSGAIRYLSLSQNNQKTSNFGLSIYPNGGYFVVKNFMIGGQTGYAYSTNNWQDFLGKAHSVSHSFNIGPELRYYLRITNKIYAHFMINASFSIGTNETKYEQLLVLNNPSSTIGATWNAGAGISFFVTKSVAVALTPMYGGSYSKAYTNKNFSGTGTELPKTNGFLFNVGFNIFIPPKGVEK